MTACSGHLYFLSHGRKNQDIVLCDVAWAFFQRHTLDGPPLQLAASPSGGNLRLEWDWGSLQISTNLSVWNPTTATSPTNFPTAHSPCFPAKITLKVESKKWNLSKAGGCHTLPQKVSA